MVEASRCPACGCELPPDSPAGLCPDCLLSVGLEGSDHADKAYYASDESFSETPASRFEPPRPEELADRFPQFEILELLGYGGMGAVYKARQSSLDRIVALKIIKPSLARDPDFAERFNREAKALARLSHQWVVTVYDFGQVDGLWYLVMEYVDGTSLRQMLKTGLLDPQQALEIVPRLCDALQYAHDEGIVHRDIKPDNILIDKRGRVKIADFGLAKVVGQPSADPTLTGTQQMMGTLRYMAPEQMNSARSVDHRADIYSLGVVFYEMLTGEVPMGQFEPPSKKAPVDGRLDAVVLRALAREPERRYQQASELKSGVEMITSLPAAASLAPDARWTAQPREGFSTIVEREASILRRWFVADPRGSGEPPRMPSALMIVLSLAGCLMLLLPWMKLEIDQNTVIRGLRVQLEHPVARTYAGSDRWPGIAAAAAFGCLALTLLIIPGAQRLSLLRSAVMTAMAGLALLHTFLFRTDLESGSYLAPIAREAVASVGAPTAGIESVTESPPGNRVVFDHAPTLSQIDRRITYREGFYGSLGLSLVLLVLSARGVSCAMAQKPVPRSKQPKAVGRDWVSLTREQVENDRLPDICIVCGSPAHTRVNKTFSYSPDWIVLLFLAGVIPGLIAAIFTSKEMRMACPVCPRHRGHWRQLVWIASTGWLLMFVLGAAGYFVASVFYPDHGGPQAAGGGIGAAVGLIVWLVPLIYLASTRVVVESITKEQIRLRRVSAGFASAATAMAESRASGGSHP